MLGAEAPTDGSTTGRSDPWKGDARLDPHMSKRGPASSDPAVSHELREARAGWPVVVPLVAAIATALAIVLNLTPGYWPVSGIAAVLVFVLLLPITFSLAGRWHPAWGAATASLFGFLASFPTFCVSGTNGTTETRCQAALFGISLPGYSGTGDNFTASLWPPIIVVLVGAAVVFAVARTKRRPE